MRQFLHRANKEMPPKRVVATTTSHTAQRQDNQVPQVHLPNPNPQTPPANAQAQPETTAQASGVRALEVMTNETLRAYYALRFPTEPRTAETQREIRVFPLQDHTEESTQKLQWIILREQYVGTYQAPELSPRLIRFVSEARSGLYPLSETEKTRLSNMTFHQPHWFTEISNSPRFTGGRKNRVQSFHR